MMPDLKLARRMAMERVPAKWLGCELTMEYAVNHNAVVFYAPGMAQDEGVVIGMQELLYAQIESVAPQAPTPTP